MPCCVWVDVGRKLGPIHYIAPEMLNEASTSAGEPADVYSFAKTIWVITTGMSYPIPGRLNQTEDAAKVSSYVADESALRLEPILDECTALNPGNRPTMRELTESLATIAS